MSTTLTMQRGERRLPGRSVPAILSLTAIVAAVFVAGVALPYFTLTPGKLGMYWPRRWWLLLHISTGAFALLSGPLQLWLGLTHRRVRLHRLLGTAYAGNVVLSSAAAYYLALHTDLGWVFGAGLSGLATAWLLTTGLACVAVARRLYDQHKEWMIRSYVLATSFVTFRMLYATLEAAGVGTAPERFAACSWLCWAIPLLIAEAVLQGRKIVYRPDSKYTANVPSQWPPS